MQKYFLHLLFVCYVFTSSIYFVEVGYEFEPIYYKLTVFLFFTLNSLIFHFKKSINSLFLLLPIVLIYVIGGLYDFAIMSMIFALSLPAVYKGIVAIKTHDVLFMLLIFLLPSIWAVINNRFDLLYNSTYGRERMLLGYFHPKEAAVSLFVIFFLLGFVKRDLPNVISTSLFGLTTYIIGSRNIAINIVISWISKFKIFFYFLILFAVVLISYLFFLDFEFLNEFSSNRLDLWREIVSFSSKSGDTIKFDSFIIETYVYSGLMGIFLLFYLYAFFYYKLRK